MMNEQIEHDATPEFLDELKSKICAGYTEEMHPRVNVLAKIFQDKSLNPLNLPFEYLLNGTLPTTSVEPIKEKIDKPAVQIEPSTSLYKLSTTSQKKKKIVITTTQ